LVIQPITSSYTNYTIPAPTLSKIGEETNSYDILVGKPTGKRQPVRPGHRWDDSNEMDLKEIGWEGIG
jgi:hypothetical protein